MENLEEIRYGILIALIARLLAVLLGLDGI
jgi:hypothetical protein